MGMWGMGLYESDEACDLRDYLSQITKLPFTADKLLTLILNHNNQVNDFSQWQTTLFWLVVADQFEKKGIICQEVIKKVNKIFNNNLDITALKQENIEEKDLKKREKILEKLQNKLAHPKPARKLPAKLAPPKIPVQTGEIYVFPTKMSDDGLSSAFNAYQKTWEDAYFTPDSWGALIILATGYLYEYLPWAAYVSLNVPTDHAANIDEVMHTKLYLSTPEQRGPIWLCQPKKSHLTKMHVQKIGEVTLDHKKIAPLLKAIKVFEEEVFIARSIHSYALNLGREPSRPLTLSLADIMITNER